MSFLQQECLEFSLLLLLYQLRIKLANGLAVLELVGESLEAGFRIFFRDSKKDLRWLRLPLRPGKLSKLGGDG